MTGPDLAGAATKGLLGTGRAIRIRGSTVVLSLLLVLAIGLFVKVPCAGGEWGDGRGFRRFCYSDIVPLYQTEHLAQGRIPYFQASNEYPVGTGMLMWLASIPARGEGSFLLVNAALLAAFAVVTVILLYREVGHRALYFGLAPTLFLYGSSGAGPSRGGCGAITSRSWTPSRSWRSPGHRSWSGG